LEPSPTVANGIKIRKVKGNCHAVMGIIEIENPVGVGGVVVGAWDI